MPIRWTESPEPVVGTQQSGLIPVPQFIRKERDILPGHGALIDVVAHFCEDTRSYGWTNESHLRNPRLRDWQLDRDVYKIKVTISSNEGNWYEYFWLCNELIPGGEFALYRRPPFEVTPPAQPVDSTMTTNSQTVAIPSDLQSATTTVDRGQCP
ncbi:MAG: hypothetical protein AB1473_01030 [Thermodesulfobacteriota bacterium]